ncbi:MAG: hypothetical protein WBN83_13340 [Desulfoprunum sp.]|jgi:hypothetical protein
MRMQRTMVDSFQLGHKDFMKNLGESLDILDHDITISIPSTAA